MNDDLNILLYIMGPSSNGYILITKAVKIKGGLNNEWYNICETYDELSSRKKLNTLVRENQKVIRVDVLDDIDTVERDDIHEADLNIPEDWFKDDSGECGAINPDIHEYLKSAEKEQFQRMINFAVEKYGNKMDVTYRSSNSDEMVTDILSINLGE